MVQELLGVALLILLGKIFEEIFVRKGYPPLVGWALAGIILGPAIFNFVEPTPELLLLTSIGVYIFFFLIGLEEVDIEGIISSVNVKHIIVPIVATVVNILALIPIGYVFGLDIRESLALGVIAAIPTSSVVAKTLSDLSLLKSKEGISIFSYILAGEFVALLFATTLLELGVNTAIDFKQVLFQLGEMVIYFVVAGWASVFVVPKLVRGVKLYMLSQGALVGVIFGIILLFVGVGEMFGVHGVVGSLILGLVLSDALLEKETKSALDVLKRIGNGVFIPLFFASIGLRFTIENTMLNPIFGLVLVFFLVPFRVLLHYGLSRIAGLAASKEIAISLMARGAVDLAILGPYLDIGLVDVATYSIIVVTSIATLILYPIMARKYYAQELGEKLETLPLMPLIARHILGMMKVKDVMDKPIFVKPNTKVATAKQMIEEEDEDCVVVSDGKGGWSIVLREDLMNANPNESVEKFTRKPRLELSPDDNLYTALEEMSLSRERVVLVKNKKGEVVGVVGPHTVLKSIIKGKSRKSKSEEQ
ncbi:MAG: hypothetical protein DRJ35_07340 [Thermoprotei archaeon]|nr:MAG: hypothetical protein DRJ35_07340 [Thermoprotei archaeon]